MPEKYWKARPTETDEYLDNPHKGCATFQRFNGDPLYEGLRWSEEGPLVFPERKFPGVTPGYLPSTVSYCRWFWEVFQPEKDRFDWSMVDRALETARERGQTLQVRLMPHGSYTQPQIPKWYGEVGSVLETVHHGRTLSVPIYDGDVYFEHWSRVIRAFAERYDGHPDLETFDVSFIGPWGEGAGECSEAGVERMAGMYADAFKKTPLMIMVQTRQLKMAPKLNAGWRCDCFGDLKQGNHYMIPGRLAWNHSFDAYPAAVWDAGASDSWKNGPVTFETCGTCSSWRLDPDYDLDFTIRQGWKYHGSILMPKSVYIPDEWRDKLMEFCKRLGYRFVLRQVRYSISVPRGDEMEFEIWIENVGVAPIYRDYKFVLRLRQDQREYIHEVNTDVRAWMPGDTIIRGRMPVPTDFDKGAAMLSAGIIHPETRKPRVKFAIKEQRDGWTMLDRVFLE